MRRFFAIVALLTVCGAARADIAPPRPNERDGTWYGDMRQVDANGESRYPVTIMLNEDGGSTDYPKLKCGGELERLRAISGGYVVYKETITRGAFDSGSGRGCIDGVVIIHAEGDNLVLGWFAAFNGEPTLASARLERK